MSKRGCTQALTFYMKCRDCGPVKCFYTLGHSNIVLNVKWEKVIADLPSVRLFRDKATSHPMSAVVDGDRCLNTVGLVGADAFNKEAEHFFQVDMNLEILLDTGILKCYLSSSCMLCRY